MLFKSVHAQMTVTMSPTTANQGSTLTATIGNHDGSTATWLCYKSGTSDPGTISCGAAGSATSISASVSGGGSVACTASATTGADVSLTWTNATQTNIRIRACTSNGDTSHTDNANVVITKQAISVGLSPITADQGDTLTASISNHISGTPTWLC